ncbi:c-type cytochrome [Sedimentitalea sp. HM32M-2]|uniref:c-type cytochrome n=1 Tax=Sedimentitalea sp. HM32M-2 TaxID=3351566 RepID=UPI00362B0604
MTGTAHFLCGVIVAVGLAAATAALAHQGVKNPAVMQRMDAMRIIADNTKALGAMAKGERAFEAAVARQAAAAIASGADRMPALFRAPEDDPKSEARPAIWQQFDDFTDRAQQLSIAADRAARGIASPADLGPALVAIGGACKSCHTVYRE